MVKQQMLRVCSLLYFYGSCCEMAHWWCRVRNAFLLVQGLLSPRGLSSYDSVWDQYTLSTCNPHPPTPLEADLLYPGGQGTLCPIDPRPDESFQFSFKFSWAALHRHQFQMPSRLTQCPIARACGQASKSLWWTQR